jgi:HK97 family phage major capsid protein
MSTEQVIKQIDAIEASMAAFQEKADQEIKNAGSASLETKNALDNLGKQQKEIADRLLEIEQAQNNSGDPQGVASMGKQFTNSDGYKSFANGGSNKVRIEVQNNTSTGSDATVAPDRKHGVVAGGFTPLNIEDLFTSIPTSSNAIEYTRELSWTNNAAEVAEAGTRAESDITFELRNMPVSSVGHFTKISKELAADSPALAAYINTRMIHGVNSRVQAQLIAGNGTTPNLSGLLDAGNFTAHGYADAALGSSLKKLALIRKMIADAYNNGFPATAIVLNPTDCAQIDIDLFQTAGGHARFGVSSAGLPTLFGLPVFESAAMTADQVSVGNFMMGATLHNRQGVIVELSDSDGSNFTQGLVTIKAERRLALTVEQPLAILAGDLTPA